MINLLLISVAIQLLLFVPAYKFKTDKLTDLSYSFTFIVLALISYFYSDMSLSKLLLLTMIIGWGLRLGVYLVIRISKIKRDSRFDEIRINFFKFLSFWLFQGFAVFVLLLPTFFFFQGNTSFSFALFSGFAIWVAGILIESFADQQKFTFINNVKNMGKWVNVGLWKYSRHPNYLGEILCWVGIYLYTFSSLPVTQKLFGALSPLTIITLLLFVSGIPKLEEKADRKWGGDSKYREYKEKTAVLLPFIY